MHGIIFAEFKKFVQATLPPGSWEQIGQRAGIGRLSNLASEVYPDEELVALVTAAVELSGVPAPTLLEQFGEFIVPDLLKVYGGFVDRRWTALDLLANTEVVIHRAVRLRDPRATPPELRVDRKSPSEVIITYASPRRLCSVAKGIMRGVGRQYKENLTIVETTCMHAGTAACTLVATLAE
ncbi:MAG TPA: heme NO-binding domain-containing protein [Gemmatimonadales bacterium]|jgi:hypothetical protein|nr:heme NO-binding domain-containing protein [Gemmatimonadales bacterium]